MKTELNMANAYEEYENRLISEIDEGRLSYAGGQEHVLDCDIVIIGAGGSGLCAAVHAAQLGANVVVLEKGAHPGGNTYMAVGTGFAVNLDAENKNKDKEDAPLAMTMGTPENQSYAAIKKSAFLRCMEIEEWRKDPKVIHRNIDTADEVYRWFLSLGMKFDLVRPQGLGITKRQAHHKNHGRGDPSNGPGYMGSYVVETMEAELKKLGGTLITRCRATELLQNPDGSAAGVLAKTKEKSYRVNAKAVILASGGFAANRQLMQKYFREQYPEIEHKILRMSSGYSTGDGLIMGEKIGAMTGEFLTIGIGGAVHHPWAWSIHAFGGPSVLQVNRNGVRFSTEATMFSWHAYVKQPGQIAYSIVDAPLKEQLKAEMLQRPLTDEEHEVLTHLDEDLLREAGEPGKKVIIADTIEELAQGIGCDPAVLKKTVDTYNSYCENGRDEEMLKPPQFLKKIETAPFYAILRQRMTIITSGGLSTDYKMRVLDQKRQPMNGFYVVGDLSNGSGSLSGTGWAFVSGYIAGMEAVEYCNEKRHGA